MCRIVRERTDVGRCTLGYKVFGTTHTFQKKHLNDGIKWRCMKADTKWREKGSGKWDGTTGCCERCMDGTALSKGGRDKGGISR